MNSSRNSARTWRNCPPCASDTYSFERTVFELENRMVEPRGDERGRYPKFVSRRSDPPLAGTANNPPPSLSDRNTTWRPSDDHDGCQSCAVEEVSRTGCPSPIGCAQMSKLPSRSEL